MNSNFVYRGILILFDELIGWFFYDKNSNRFDFDDRETCKQFIDKKIIKD
jgi:hypothetical protein